MQLNDASQQVEQWQRALVFLAGIAVVLSVVVSGYGILCHVTSYMHPERQRRVVRILLMVPLYALNSYMSLNFLDIALYLDTLRDCYEAYVLYQFFLLCVSLLDGEQNVRHVLSHKPDHHFYWPCCCLPTLKLSSMSYYLTLKKGILQFVLVKPFFAIIAVIMQARGGYCDREWRPDCFYVYHTVAINISQTIALTSLALFYQAIKEELQPWNPVWKFLCIKAIIFFSYWQGFFFALLQVCGVLHDIGRYTSIDLASALQNFLICLEMVVFAVAHLYVFGPQEYYSVDRGTMAPRYAISDILSCFDVVRDTRETFDILPPPYTQLETTSELADTVIVRTMRGDQTGSDLYQLSAVTQPISYQPQNLNMGFNEALNSPTNRPNTRYGGL